MIKKISPAGQALGRFEFCDSLINRRHRSEIESRIASVSDVKDGGNRGALLVLYRALLLLSPDKSTKKDVSQKFMSAVAASDIAELDLDYISEVEVDKITSLISEVGYFVAKELPGWQSYRASSDFQLTPEQTQAVAQELNHG